jgi:hypothetical protein
VQGEVFLVLVGAHDGGVEAGEDIPVEVTQVVAFGVLAVVGELDGDAFLAGEAFAADAPGEGLPRVKAEAVEEAEFSGF